MREIEFRPETARLGGKRTRSQHAADTIEHLHNLLGHETEEGLDAIIGIQRILAEINYR